MNPISRLRRIAVLTAVLSSLLLANHPAAAQTTDQAPQKNSPSQDSPKTAPKPLKTPAGAVALNKAKTVLIDREAGRVLLQSQVVLSDGILEMLVCKSQTKEHESILAVNSKAFVIHTALLALGAKPGSPVKFAPKFQPPTGQVIDIFVNWADEKGVPQRTRAQEWVRSSTRRYYVRKLEQLPAGVALNEELGLRYDPKAKELFWYGQMTDKQREALFKQSPNAKYRQLVKSIFAESQPQPMQADWVFTGSGFYVDEETGERFYQAESGDFICVANFASAMLDVAVQSTATGESELLFEANPDRVPPLGTPVLIELVPRKPKPAQPKSK